MAELTQQQRDLLVSLYNEVPLNAFYDHPLFIDDEEIDIIRPLVDAGFFIFDDKAHFVRFTTTGYDHAYSLSING